MRRGINPEKFKAEKNNNYLHRVIIPIYIPNIKDKYYTHSLEVLDWCLNSLIETIDLNITAITLLNNNSTDLINPILNKYLLYVDKYVVYQENKGKVYTVYSEAKSSYEPFITIADADVFFFSGWENEVFNIFKCYKKAGVVSPLPQPSMALKYNYSVFFEKYLLGKIKYKKIVEDVDLDLYLQGLGNNSLLNRNNKKYSWRSKQYYLNNKVKAVIGAGHFVATYRREIFNTNLPFPEIKFKNGYENIYLDAPSDRVGLYRLSTIKTYAYHMGNEVETFLKSTFFEKSNLKVNQVILELRSPKKSQIPYFIKRIFFKILLHIRKL